MKLWEAISDDVDGSHDWPLACFHLKQLSPQESSRLSLRFLMSTLHRVNEDSLLDELMDQRGVGIQHLNDGNKSCSMAASGVLALLSARPTSLVRMSSMLLLGRSVVGSHTSFHSVDRDSRARGGTFSTENMTQGSLGTWNGGWKFYLDSASTYPSTILGFIVNDVEYPVEGPPLDGLLAPTNPFPRVPPLLRFHSSTRPFSGSSN